MLLIVDKPTGITSFDVIRRLKHHPLLTPEPPAKKTKIWHAGTLDPLATWLMLVATHRDTKSLQTLIGHDKSYRAEIDLSTVSDTRDSDERKDKLSYDVVVQNGHKGIIKDDVFVPAPDDDHIAALLDQAMHQDFFPLPPFCAKKVKGKKLYEYARAWQPLFLESQMDFDAITLVDYSFPFVTLDVSVGSGTYIRSLAYRLGQQCQMGGIITWLRRTRVGDYVLADYDVDQEWQDLSFAVLQSS